MYQFNTTDRTSKENIGFTLHSLSLTNRPFLEELGEVVSNSSKVTISLKKANEKLSDEVKSLQSQVDTLTTEKIEYAVDKAIANKKLRPEQKQYALNLATNDLEGFNSFIANNTIVSIPQDNIYANSTNKTSDKSGKSDIDFMIDIASKQVV